jgi:hypothetical protein
VALVLLAAAATVAIGAEPQAPKLESVPPPATAAAPEPPARQMPDAQAICIDRTARRCWSGERAEDCRAAGGELFATIGAAQGDPGALLRSCWDQMR